MAPGTARILVVEDEDSIGQGLCDVLTFRGHAVEWAKDGRTAVDTATAGDFDLILLDVMLPELNGYEVCRKLRAAKNSSGIIMLTAKGSEDDILRGFEMGADDYVTKPFSLRQLLARVDALLGRSQSATDETLSVGGLTIDPTRATASGPGGSVELSARELDVLRMLLDDPGRIVSRRQLLRDAWQMKNPEAIETRTVDVHIAKLRKKLSPLAAGSIQTVRGLGYRFATDGAK
ncbi:MAG: response regulator transcription factor [Polyangiaceae bacterium]|nr:response regulator transcription factor [Polyangiaceae bacterium]